MGLGSLQIAGARYGRLARQREQLYDALIGPASATGLGRQLEGLIREMSVATHPPGSLLINVGDRPAQLYVVGSEAVVKTVIVRRDDMKRFPEGQPKQLVAQLSARRRPFVLQSLMGSTSGTPFACVTHVESVVGTVALETLRSVVNALSAEHRLLVLAEVNGAGLADIYDACALLAYETAGPKLRVAARKIECSGAIHAAWSQTDLAEMAGLTRCTVCKTLRHTRIHSFPKDDCTPKIPEPAKGYRVDGALGLKLDHWLNQLVRAIGARPPAVEVLRRSAALWEYDEDDVVWVAGSTRVALVLKGHLRVDVTLVDPRAHTDTVGAWVCGPGTILGPAAVAGARRPAVPINARAMTDTTVAWLEAPVLSAFLGGLSGDEYLALIRAHARHLMSRLRERIDLVPMSRADRILHVVRLLNAKLLRTDEHSEEPLIRRNDLEALVATSRTGLAHELSSLTSTGRIRMSNRNEIEVLDDAGRRCGVLPLRLTTRGSREVRD